MRRLGFFPFAILSLIQFMLGILLSPPSLAQDWQIRVKPKGTIRVVDLWEPFVSAMLNQVEGLVTLDKDNNFVPCLAEDWRWVDDRTIEFQLCQGVTFHNGEKFNAAAVQANWEAYKKMQTPRPAFFTNLPDETIFEIMDE